MDMIIDGKRVGRKSYVLDENGCRTPRPPWTEVFGTLPIASSPATQPGRDTRHDVSEMPPQGVVPG